MRPSGSVQITATHDHARVAVVIPYTGRCLLVKDHQAAKSTTWAVGAFALTEAMPFSITAKDEYISL